MKTTIAIIFVSLSVYANFNGEQEAGMNVIGGNTDLKAYNFKSNNAYEWENADLSIKGAYNYGESDEIRSAENWNINTRYGHRVYHKLSWYVGEVIESNRFNGISRRYNTDLGLKYFLSKHDTRHFFTEAGYRYSVERSTDNSIKKKEDSRGRVYSEYKNEFKKDMKVKYWIEYLPNFTESEDYLVNMEPSLTFALSSIFSFKTAYLWQYDNQPIPGNGKHDYQFTLSLIANI